MYRRNNIESKREIHPSLINLNTKYFQEMYLDTSSLSSSSISPTISSAPSSPLRLGAPCSLTPTSTTSGTSTYNEYQYGLTVDDSANIGFASSAALSSMIGPETTTNNSPDQNWAVQYYNDYLQQQYILYYQRQLAASAAIFTPPEYTCPATTAVATEDNSSQNQDEISKSLKMFALLTSHKTERSQLVQSPVDVIMQDFANNGNICDELKYNQQYHQYQAALNFASSHHNFTTNSSHSNITCNNIAAANATINNHNIQKNLWMLPAPMQHSSGMTSAAAAAANIDYNNNSYNPNKKPQKRYNNYKNDKFSAKHCVFCENNKEPEAVVKSHAVRDSLGRVLCPKLRTYICPICKASGDMAHTVKYCPQKPIITMEDAIKAETFRLNNKGHYYKQQTKV